MKGNAMVLEQAEFQFRDEHGRVDVVYSLLDDSFVFLADHNSGASVAMRTKKINHRNPTLAEARRMVERYRHSQSKST